MMAKLSGRINYKLLLPLVVVLILLGMLISTSSRYFDSPNVGTVGGIASTTVVSATARPAETTLMVEGKTFSFSYPSFFQPDKLNPVTGSDIEKFAFIANRTSAWNLNVKVTTLLNGLLTNDVSYNLRKTNPQTYSEQHTTYGSNDVHIMSAVGGYNKVAFLVHGNIDADIVLTSSSSSETEAMDTALKQILSTWKWL